MPHTSPGADASGQQFRQVPQYIIAQLHPGADLPNVPHDALVRISGATHTATGSAKRPTTISPGSLIVMAAPKGTTAHGHEVPIIVGMVVDTSSKKGILVVAWYLPELARIENFRQGAKNMWICSGLGCPWTTWAWRQPASVTCQVPSLVLSQSWSVTSSLKKISHCHMMCSMPCGQTIPLT